MLRNIYIYFVKYSHSTTKYISTDLQQHNIQKTKTILLQCKNPLFTRQKPYFCNAKTILLFFVSITNTLLMCYEYSVKWLRTFHKMPTNTPQGVGDRFIVPVSLHYQIHIFISPNIHFRFIIHEYSHYQIYVSIPHFLGVYVYAGTINQPLQLLTDCHFAANRLR